MIMMTRKELYKELIELRVLQEENPMKAKQKTTNLIKRIEYELGEINDGKQ